MIIHAQISKNYNRSAKILEVASLAEGESARLAGYLKTERFDELSVN